MSKVIALLIVIGVFGVIIFGGLIYPIWMIVHCANSERSGGKKATWIIFMILVWPIVSIFYGLLASGRTLFKWISVFYLMGVIALIALMMVGVPWSSKIIVQQMRGSVDQIDQMKTEDLSPDNIIELKHDMNILLNEVQADSSLNVFQFKNKRITISLLELFEIYTRDKRITPTEYADLINKFKSRDMLDYNSLRERIRSLRGIKISN